MMKEWVFHPSEFVIPCSMFCGSYGQQTGQLQNK